MIFNKLHRVISQETVFFINTVVITLNPTNRRVVIARVGIKWAVPKFGETRPGNFSLIVKKVWNTFKVIDYASG